MNTRIVSALSGYGRHSKKNYFKALLNANQGVQIRPIQGHKPQQAGPLTRYVKALWNANFGQYNTNIVEQGKALIKKIRSIF